MHLGEWAEKALPALGQNQNVAANVLDHRQQVRTDDDRRSRFRALANRTLERPNAVRIESRQRFVKQDGHRVMQVGGADGQFLFHAPREIADRRLLAPGPTEIPAAVRNFDFGLLDLISGGRKGQVLGHGQVVKQLRIVRDVRQPSLGRERRFLDLET